MNSHLTSRQVSEWIAGQRTPATAAHVASCADCAGEIERAAETLGLFRKCVGALGEEQMGPARFRVPADREAREAHPLRWRLALAMGVLAAVAAIPLARHEAKPAHVAVRATTQVSHEALLDEALLNDVKTEISRSVPPTMEPLERLMSSSERSVE